jgi:transposase-like protein
MGRSTSHETATGDLLAAIRAVRFRQAINCPRCKSDRVQRWGSFSDRQRYRCCGCRRTFSDLTGTPAAYLKKLQLWVPYSDVFGESLSVRRAAAQVGIHPCTAFRWRHVLLDALRMRDADKLAGWIELGSLWFAYSDKGRRDLHRAPRSHGVIYPLASDQVGANVLVAADRRGGVITSVTSISRPRRVTCSELEHALAQRILGRPNVIANEGRFGASSVFARRRGGSYHDARPNNRRPPGKPIHLRTASAYACRLKHWLKPFQGVATRYLSNYLIWHRALERSPRHVATSATLPWPVAAAIA